MNEWMNASRSLYHFGGIVDASLFLSCLPHPAPLYPLPPTAFEQDSYVFSFGFAKALQTVSLGNVPLSPESVCYWAAGTKQWSSFLLSLSCSVCPGENIKCVHKVHAKIFMNIFGRFLLKPPLSENRTEETNRQTWHTKAWGEIYNKQLVATDHFALGYLKTSLKTYLNIKVEISPHY